MTQSNRGLKAINNREYDFGTLTKRSSIAFRHWQKWGLLDLASFESIRAFAADFSKQHKSIDSLMLNAGLMMPRFETTKEGLEMHMGVEPLWTFLAH